MARTTVRVEEGDLFAIPLFVYSKNSLHRFKTADFEGPNCRFVFMRVVASLRGGGILVEVLDIEGPLDTMPSRIIQACRLFRPVAVTGLAIHKKRWPHIGRQEGYDKERMSQFSSIELVEGTEDLPVLWRGGRKEAITPQEASRLERWITWTGPSLEKRIIGELKSRGR
jgi:hypothetical protein